jgi:predicted phosphodiesterase
MILFLSDIHCRFDVIEQQAVHAQTRTGKNIEAVVILGDLGLYEPFLKRYFRARTPPPARPLFFIEGNHEDYDSFERLVARYTDVLTHLPRGQVRKLGRTRFLCIGGAQYMDAHLTPERSVIRPEDIARCLEHPPETVDIVLSHDCPRNIGMTNSPGMAHYGPPGFTGSEQIVSRFHPALWLFGHHHRWYDRTVDGTRFVGLPQSWRGYLLLDDGGHVQPVDNRVAPHKTALQRIVARLRRRHHDRTTD